MERIGVIKNTASPIRDTNAYYPKQGPTPPEPVEPVIDLSTLKSFEVVDVVPLLPDGPE